MEIEHYKKALLPILIIYVNISKNLNLNLKKALLYFKMDLYQNKLTFLCYFFHKLFEIPLHSPCKETVNMLTKLIIGADSFWLLLFRINSRSAEKRWAWSVALTIAASIRGSMSLVGHHQKQAEPSVNSKKKEHFVFSLHLFFHRSFI